jgi:hypothetical protein
VAGLASRDARLAPLFFDDVTVCVLILLRNYGPTNFVRPLPALPFRFILSLDMDVEELETLLRKQAHTEEERARIIGSCNLLAYKKMISTPSQALSTSEFL